MTVSIAMVPRLAIQLLASAKAALRLLARIHPRIAVRQSTAVLLAWMTPTAMTVSSAMAQRIVTRVLANAKLEPRPLVATIATS